MGGRATTRQEGDIGRQNSLVFFVSFLFFLFFFSVVGLFAGQNRRGEKRLGAAQDFGEEVLCVYALDKGLSFVNCCVIG